MPVLALGPSGRASVSRGPCSKDNSGRRGYRPGPPLNSPPAPESSLLPLPLPKLPRASLFLAEKSQRWADGGWGPSRMLPPPVGACFAQHNPDVPRLPVATGPHGNAEQRPGRKAGQGVTRELRELGEGS